MASRHSIGGPSVPSCLRNTYGYGKISFTKQYICAIILMLFFAFLTCGLAILAGRILCKITIKYKMVLIYLYIVI